MKYKMLLKSTICVFLSVSLLSSCGGSNDESSVPSPAPEKEMATLKLTSPAFTNGEPIPAKYSRNNENFSPPLEWTEPPTETQSMALICDDPDAPSGTWVHWIIYNLPSDARSLPEAIPTDANLADSSRNGKNSWNELGYDGPSPPSGTHRYYFKIYALDTILDLEPGASKDDLIESMDTHILAYGELIGTYSK